MNFEQELEKVLDEQFPKGDKARGRALVLYSMAVLLWDKKKEVKK